MARKKTNARKNAVKTEKQGEPTGQEKQANAPVATQEAAKHGLKGFRNSTIIKSITAAFEASKQAKIFADLKSVAALAICKYAHKLRTNDHNATLTGEAFAQGWRYNMKAILAELHKAGIDWVTVRTGAEGQTLYALTSYGQNVSSCANQCGQYADIVDTENNLVINFDKITSYTQAMNAVKSAKLIDHERSMSDDERNLDAALSLFGESIVAFAKIVKQSKSLGITERATDVIVALIQREADEQTALDNAEGNGKLKVVEDTPLIAELAELMAAAPDDGAEGDDAPDTSEDETADDDGLTPAPVVEPVPEEQAVAA